jgi:membrane protease YdiL (CAAX protease family)
LTDTAMTRWKAIGWTVAFFVAGIALTVGAHAGLAGLFPAIDPLRAGVIAQIVGFGAATWGIGGGALKWGWKELRYAGAGSPFRGVGMGLALGAAPAVLAMAIAAPAGGAGWSLDGGSFGSWAAAIGGLALILVPAAFSEELIFRGVGYVALGRAFGKLGPAVAISVLFAAAHLGNPNVTGLGLVNVGLAGVWLSAAFWLPGGIWTATATHLGWNLTLAALGAPVSGLAFTLPMLDYATGGPGWLTGGAFGPEGGVIATGVVGAATVLLLRMTKQDSRLTTNDS